MGIGLSMMALVEGYIIKNRNPLFIQSLQGIFKNRKEKFKNQYI